MINQRCYDCGKNIAIDTITMNSNTNSPSDYDMNYYHTFKNKHGFYSIRCNRCHYNKKIKNRDKEIRKLIKKWWEFWK